MVFDVANGADLFSKIDHLEGAFIVSCLAIAFMHHILSMGRDSLPKIKLGVDNKVDNIVNEDILLEILGLLVFDLFLDLCWNGAFMKWLKSGWLKLIRGDISILFKLNVKIVAVHISLSNC